MRGIEVMVAAIVNPNRNVPVKRMVELYYDGNMKRFSIT